MQRTSELSGIASTSTDYGKKVKRGTLKPDFAKPLKWETIGIALVFSSPPPNCESQVANLVFDFLREFKLCGRMEVAGGILPHGDYVFSVGIGPKSCLPERKWWEHLKISIQGRCIGGDELAYDRFNSELGVWGPMRDSLPQLGVVRLHNGWPVALLTDNKSPFVDAAQSRIQALPPEIKEMANQMQPPQVPKRRDKAEQIKRRRERQFRFIQEYGCAFEKLAFEGFHQFGRGAVFTRSQSGSLDAAALIEYLPLEAINLEDGLNDLPEKIRTYQPESQFIVVFDEKSMYSIYTLGK